MLLKAIGAGSAEADNRLRVVLSEKLKASGLSEDERFELRALEVEANAARARSNGQPSIEAKEAFERGARSLIQQFPRRTEPYLMLLSTIEGMEATKARGVTPTIAAGRPFTLIWVPRTAGLRLNRLFQ